MPRFVVERSIPNAALMTARELRDLSAKSCRVLHDLGPQIQWVQSFVTDHKLYCHFIAPSAEMVREHALRGCLPVDSIREVIAIADPTTAE